MSTINHLELFKPTDASSELTSLTYGINDMKHRIITRLLYHPCNGLETLDSQLQNSVTVLTDEREKGDFISIMLDGTWGLRNGKNFSLDRFTVPDRVLFTWALIRDREFQTQQQSFVDAYEKIESLFDNGKISTSQYHLTLDDLEMKDVRDTRRYLEAQQIPILRGFSFDMEVTQEFVKALYHM